jgi:hypothetical protein
MNRPMFIGLVFLLFANLSSLWTRFPAGFSVDTIDGVRGVLFGIAIGSLILGIRRQSHECRTSDDPRSV